MAPPKKYNNIIIEQYHAKIEIISPKYGLFYGLIDLDDIELVKNYTWYVNHAKLNNTFYARTNIIIDKKQHCLLLHRLITNCPREYDIDHIDGNTMNNLKSNLRQVTMKQNQENKQSCQKNNKSSGIRGVTWKKHNNCWEVAIYNNKKRIYGCCFNNIEQAELKAIEMRKQYFTHSKECCCA